MQQKFTWLFVCLFLLFGSQIEAQNVVIQEVLYNPAPGITKKIALKNVSGSVQNVSNWCLCNVPSYKTIGSASFNVLSGNPTALQPGEVLILELTATSPFSMSAPEGEILLYNRNGCGDYNNIDIMEDFVRWGPSPPPSGGTREARAALAGLWNSGDIIPTAAVGEILIFDGTSDGGGNVSLSSDFTNSPNGILPVTLLDFSLTQMDDRVQLKWVTAEELNSECFKVERSFDGMRYEQITRVEAAGTTNETTYYQYEDMEVFGSRTVYYRLKQMDFDGSLFCSSVEVINLAAPPKVPIIISPNPISSAECLTITLGSTQDRTYENMSIVLYSAMGLVIQTYPSTDFIASGEQTYIDFPSGLNPGYYVISIFDGKEMIESARVIVN